MKSAGKPFLIAGASIDPVVTQSTTCDCGGTPSDCETGGGGGCHPAKTMLEMDDGTERRIDSIEPGNLIRTPTGYKPVLGFLHAEVGTHMPYLRLITTNSSVMLSKEHLLVVDGQLKSPEHVARGNNLESHSESQRVIQVEHTVQDDAPPPTPCRHTQHRRAGAGVPLPLSLRFPIEEPALTTALRLPHIACGGCLPPICRRRCLLRRWSSSERLP